MKIGEYMREKAGLFDDDPDYQVRRVSGSHYQVTKWVKGKMPKEVFDVYDKSPKAWTCNCPVRGGCKHIMMVKGWLKDGEPNGLLTDKEAGDIWKNL